MRPLTALERELIQRKVELALGWEMLQNYQRINARTEAKAVVAELERGAVSGATEKRALEALCQP